MQVQHTALTATLCGRSFWQCFRYVLVAAGCVALSSCIGIPGRLDKPTLVERAPLAGVPVDTTARWPAANWWTRFGDPQLDRFEDEALRDSPSIALARARFEVALRQVDQARAARRPGIDASASYTRARLSDNALTPTDLIGFSWYKQGDLGLQFSYDFDFWGRNRALLESSVRESEATQVESNASALMLTTSVADTYFALQGDMARVTFAEQVLAAQQRNLDIVADRTRQGIQNPDDLRTAEQTLADARETLEQRRGSVAIDKVGLAALIGVSPAQLPAIELQPLPAVNRGLPPNASMELISRRSEIVAARLRVEASLQDVAASRSAFYPDISISAMAGLSSIDLGKLLDSGSRVYNFMPTISLPIFDGGKLRADYGVSRAQLDEAIATYDQAVADGAQDVATQALSLQNAQDRALARVRQVDAIRRQRDAAAARVASGIVDQRTLIAADVQLLQQRDAAEALAAEATSYDIALIKALGGGYSQQSASQAMGGAGTSVGGSGGGAAAGAGQGAAAGQSSSSSKAGGSGQAARSGQGSGSGQSSGPVQSGGSVQDSQSSQGTGSGQGSGSIQGAVSGLSSGSIEGSGSGQGSQDGAGSNPSSDGSDAGGGDCSNPGAPGCLQAPQPPLR